MGKDLVPRFKCPLCGWLAYYTMLSKGPYKLEIKGMRYDGFQEISYHHIWTGKREYKEFLRIKVRELAKELGIKLADEADEEDVTDEGIKEIVEEIGFEPSEEVRDDVEGESQKARKHLVESQGASPIVKTPSRTVIRTERVTPSAEVSAQLSGTPEMVEALQELFTSRLMRTPSSGQKPFGKVIKTEATFIGGENNG
jgi:hypothetical protein